MKVSYVDGPSEVARCLNAVALQNAVLCAECDVVSDSPHDRCLVCGSRSLFNISRMLGGASVKACLPCWSFQESPGRSGRSVQGD
jgi:hypothetical protein